MATYKIIKLERMKRNIQGVEKELAKVTLRDAVESTETSDVTIWSEYPNFSALEENYTTEGDIVVNAKGYKTLYPARTKTLGGGGKGSAAIAKAQTVKREDIKAAQENKHEAIKMAGTARDATLLTVAWYEAEVKNFPVSDAEVKAKWLEWRKWLEENHGDGQPF